MPPLARERIIPPFREWRKCPEPVIRRYSSIFGIAPNGFTLLELLIVATIMIGMMMLLPPAFKDLNSNTEFVGALYKIAGKLEEARTYAIANNTHVFVGFEEVDSSKAASASPQTPASAATGGRIAVAIFASRDGTSVYDINALSNWESNYGKGDALYPLGKLATFENLHMVDFGAPPDSGSMQRPAASSNYIIASSDCISSTPFTYPHGANLTSGYKFYFSKVIEFAPQGTARVISATNGDSIPKVMEIGLQAAHHNILPPAPTNQNVGKHAAIQIYGYNGSVKIYRP